MPTTLSKQTTSEEEEIAAQKIRDEQIWYLMIHGFLNVSVLCTTISSEIQHFNMLFNGDVPKAATYLAYASGLGGLIEFFVNPTIGKLTDSYGRKKFMLVGPTASFIFNGLCFLFPKVLPIVMFNRAVTVCCITISGSVTGSAMVADIYEGRPTKELASGIAKYFSSFGLGVVFGPIWGSLFFSIFNQTSYVYLGRSLLGLFELCHDSIRLQESLPIAKRIPFDGKFVNPFRFLELLSSKIPKTLRKLVIAIGLISTTEGKNTNNIYQQWMRTDVNLSDFVATVMTTLMGGAMYFAGPTCRYLVGNITGERGYTRSSLTVTILGYLIWSQFPNFAGLLLGFALYWPCANATSNTVLKAQAMKHATAFGYGKGAFSGLSMNLRALTMIVTPLIAGNVYASLLKNKRNPSLVWLVYALSGAIIPLLIHESISDEEMENPQKGGYKEMIEEGKKKSS
eukprot:g9128.t1